ncbi:MAG: hypothetical protein ACOC0A_04450 [Planctomycetota bacterium]
MDAEPDGMLASCYFWGWPGTAVCANLGMSMEVDRELRDAERVEFCGMTIWTKNRDMLY